MTSPASRPLAKQCVDGAGAVAARFSSRSPHEWGTIGKHADGDAPKERTMHPTDDPKWARREIVDPITAALESAEIYLAVEVRDGSIWLVGEVDNEANRQAALDIAGAVAEAYGLGIDESIEVTEEILEAGYPIRGADLDDLAGGDGEREDVSLDLTAHSDTATLSELGTVDAEEAGEEAVPYFPPTDPPVGPDSSAEQLEMVNGFASTSMEDFGDAGARADDITGFRKGDDQLADDIRRELREDALTIDLNVQVLVVSGVVYLRGIVETLDDAENAEAVAARVPGVVEVMEQLTIPGLRAERR
jgi:osmotically-inducible protein OsmY